MDLFRTANDLRARLGNERSVALVPTMGNLHAGHLALVEAARKHGTCVVASIFVNRLQFDPNSDFDRYPRTLDNDCKLLERAGCNVVFAPDEREMYPVEQEMVVSPPVIAGMLEGEFRPGHFQGVATVVSKLFNIVSPQAAMFGKKDYQQLQVVRALVRQLNFPIEIVGVDTVREADGLAMSSRNGYLSAAERLEAVRLGQNLKRMRERIAAGEQDFEALARGATADLSAHGWKVDYISVRGRSRLQAPEANERELVIVAAAWLGKTRLIDNLEAARL